MCVVDIVRKLACDVSFSLPFFDGDGKGGGCNGFNSGCGLCDGGIGGGGGGAGRRDLCLDDSGAVLEVEGSRNAGGIRLKVDSVDCLWS